MKVVGKQINILFIDAMSNSLNLKFLQYQKDYYPKLSSQRFDTDQCFSGKLKQLAYD